MCPLVDCDKSLAKYWNPGAMEQGVGGIGNGATGNEELTWMEYSVEWEETALESALLCCVSITLTDIDNQVFFAF